MANGLLMLTRCTGFSYSVAEPMSKEPAGTTTSSPQVAQSRNTSPGLKLPDGSVAGAVDETCGAGLAAGAGAGAGAGVAAGAGAGAGAAEGAAATGRELPK